MSSEVEVPLAINRVVHKFLKHMKAPRNNKMFLADDSTTTSSPVRRDVIREFMCKLLMDPLGLDFHTIRNIWWSQELSTKAQFMQMYEM